MTSTLRLCLLLALSTTLYAASVSDDKPLAATFSPVPLTIDGQFGDWPEVKSSKLAPFREVAGLADPAMARIFEAHPQLLAAEAELLAAHDRDSLYLGMRLGDADPAVNTATTPDDWSHSGDGVVVHGLDAAGRAFSVLWWGVAADGSPRVSVQLAGAAWQGLGALGGAAAIQVDAGKGCRVEIRLPWRALGFEVGPARLDMVWEVAFSGVDAALFKEMPQQMRLYMKLHSTYGVLTAPEKLAARGYMPQPAMWGTLRFAAADALPGELQQTAAGSGITDWQAPRRTTPLTIDGKLDDWPAAWLLSAAPAAWAYGDRYRADVGIAWDDRMLYLAIRYRDGEPMYNTEVAEKQMGFRGGDCVQVRLKAGDRTANLCGWYDTKNGIAALTADGKERKEPNLLAAGAHEAFAPLPGGRGYVQEMAIPFSELAAGSPALNDTWQLTFQLWWAGMDERFSVETAIEFTQPAPLQTPFELPRDANVSLGVFDADGKLLRHLLKDEPRTDGTNTVYWDGLDQWGKVLPAGDYRLKGVHHEPLLLDHIMTATNPGTPPWWTIDGKGGWMSDQAAAQDAVTDGTVVYLAAPYAEAGHAIIAVGPDGKRLWGINPHVGTPRCVSLALLGDRLYAMFSGPELTAKVNGYKDGDDTAEGRAIMFCFDKRTGELAGPSVKSGAAIKFTSWPYRHDVHSLWDLRTQQAYSPATYGGMHRYSNSGMCETTSGLGLAAVGKRLVAAMWVTNELLVLDPDSLEVTAHLPLPSPAGLHGLDDHTLLAVSGTQVVKVDLDTATITPVVTSGLVAPFGVTTDRAGLLYVSDWGTSFQVKVYRPDGSFLRAIGKEGGRPWIGDFTPEGMALPRGMAVTDDGKLWVAEDEFSPRRVSVWNAATGALIRDYIGPANYRGWGLTIDPKDPQRFITTGTEFQLDFAKKTYTPLKKVFLRRSRDDVFTPDGNGMGAFSKILYRDGREFMVNGSRDRLTVMVRVGDEYRPVAALSGMEAGQTIDGTQKTFWDSDLRYHALPGWNPEFFKGHVGQNHIWNDLNGDTVAQADEMIWQTDTLRRGDPYVPGRMGEWGVPWGLAFGPNWEVYMHGFCRDAIVVYRFDPEFSAEGFPRYSFDRCTPIIVQTGKDRMKVDNLYATDSGLLILSAHNEVNREAYAEKGIIAYDRDGKELWSIVGPHDISPKAVYGYANAEFRYPDLGSGVVTWVWWHNGRAYLVAADGLYLAGFLDNDLAVGPTFTRRGGETSSFAIQGPDGRLFLINGANSAHHILEIKGLATAKRWEQPLTITDADVVAATRAQAAGNQAQVEQPVILVKAGGSDAATDGVQLVTTRKAGRGGTVALSTDGTYLYVKARILDETPMVNDGDNWQTPFVSGDCLDLMLATSATADPERRRAAEGDVRLLFTELRKEPVAVLYRPVAPGAKAPVQMLATTIDDVRRLPDCAPTIVREAGAYTLTTRVPLAELGFTALPKELRGDIGIIYGDATGRDRDQRLYYYNKATGMISDLTTEASLNPDKWGRILVANPANLVQDPDFEGKKKALSDSWVVGASKNGAVAHVTDSGPFAGGQALLLEQQLPIALPATKTKDAATFYRQLNDGAGGGFTLVDQRIPVQGGQAYDLRLAYRSEGLVRELRGGAPGYAIFAVWIFWGNGQGGVGHEWALRVEDNHPDWQLAVNPRSGFTPIAGIPYTAPANATFATLRLQLVVNTPTAAKVAIDHIEFAPAPKD